MFTRRRPDLIGDPAPTPDHRRNEWLPRRWDSSVWRLTLRGVSDHLNADALWDYSTGSGPAIVESVSGDRHRRLRRALVDHCHWRERRDALHGKLMREQQPFSDLILCLPPLAWERDQREEGGLNLKCVAQNLEWHHKQGFRKGQHAGRLPHCLVRPQPGLAEDQVEFLFGKAVYLPDPDESPAYHLVPSLGDDYVELPTLGLWYGKGSDKVSDRVYKELPAGFYENQQWLLLTPEGQGPLPVPGWHEAADAYLLICRTGQDDWKPFCPDSVKVRVWRAPAGAWVFELKPAQGQGGQVLTLELQPNVAASAMDAGKTRMPGAAPAVSPYTLELEAVALPDLALEQPPNLLSWTLWLDADGTLATPEQVARDRTDLIALRLDKRGLQLTCPAASPQGVGARVPDQLQVGDTEAWLLPSTIPGVRGLLDLASPTPYPLPPGYGCILGRTNDVDPSRNPDIALDQLAQPGGLLWPGSGRDSTLGTLGLSREHANVWVEGGHLLAARIDADKAKGRLLHLDPDYRPKPPLADPSAPCVWPPTTACWPVSLCCASVLRTVVDGRLAAPLVDRAAPVSGPDGEPHRPARREPGQLPGHRRRPRRPSHRPLAGGGRPAGVAHTPVAGALGAAGTVRRHGRPPARP